MILERLYETKAWDAVLGACVGVNIALGVENVWDGDYSLATWNVAGVVIVLLAWLMRILGLRGWRRREADWAVLDAQRQDLLRQPLRIEVAEADEGYTVLVTRVSGEVDVLRMPEEIDPHDPEEAVSWVLEQLREPPAAQP